MKSEHSVGLNPLTHPNPHIAQILKSVDKNGCSLYRISYATGFFLSKHIFTFSERVVSSIITLKEDEISRVTDVISAKNRFRFAIEYLEINPNEYHTIESEAQFNHHDTLHECIRRWRNRTEAQGVNTKDELIRILNAIRQTHGWFPFDAMSFLTDVTGMEISEPSKGPHVHTNSS